MYRRYERKGRLSIADKKGKGRVGIEGMKGKVRVDIKV